MDATIFNDRVWKLVKGYLDESTLIKHQIDTFNDFMLRKLEETIDGFNAIEINNQYLPEHDTFRLNISVVVKNPVLSKPTIHEKDGSTKIMTPNDARLRNFTYAAPLNVDIEITYKTYDEATTSYRIDTKKLNGINLGKIPIMVKSKYCVLTTNMDTTNMNECRYDPGGYFIVNGNEKVVISQDRISENKTFVFTNTKTGTAYSHLGEIRSVAESRFGVPKTTSLKLSAKSNHFGRYIRINIHHIKHDVPLFVIFKALGIESDKQILQYILYDTNDPANEVVMKELVGSIDEASDVICARDALEYLSRYLHINGYPREMITNKHHRLNILRSVMETEFLPHVGTSFHKKALYLGYMTKKLVMCYLGLWSMDDRDSYINKRVDSPGVLMANLFRQYYGKMVKDMKNMVQKEMNNGSWKATGQFSNVINKVNVYKIVKSTVIESGLKYALATGNWGVKSNKNKQGVAQVLNRLTFNATLSHLRRVNTPLEKSGKLVQPRKLHNTQFGYICPAECFDPKTPILMWDGTIKEAKDIIVGDNLIDDNGNAVRVKSTCAGSKAMYEIVPKKRNFMSHTVTDNHILTLKIRLYRRNKGNSNGKKVFSWFDKNEMRYRTKYFDNETDVDKFRSSLDDDDVIDVTIEKYMALPENVRKNLYLFKSGGINWEHKDVALDPYILGSWLGDGLSSGYGFATADKELLDKWNEWGKDNDATITKGLRYAYTIGSTINKTQSGINCNKSEAAPLKKLLAKYGLVKNKHIPLDYLVNDRKTRLAVLAGLVDTDGNVRANGHEIRICQGERNYRILHDAEFLAQSLGYSCHVSEGISTYSVNGEKRKTPYKELTITGEKLHEIPTVLPRKKLNKFENSNSVKKCASYLRSSFQLIKKEEQPFVGWQLDGSGRFLLGDMSTSHNTPEGSSVGLVKNLSMMAGVTIASNSANVRSILIDVGMIAFDGTNIGIFAKNATKVMVNGDIIGIHDFPVVLYNKLKEYKRGGVINIYTSIGWNVHRNELSINTEGGRCVRPVFVLSEGQKEFSIPNGSWKDLVINGHIEFLDVEESNTSMIAMNHLDIAKGDKGSSKRPLFTHLEIHPSLILGVLAGNIPFSNHNQAPRNCYQSSMGKQAIGIYSSNFRHRFDTMAHVLNYPQKPIVETNISKLVCTGDMPCGVNAIVAIACMTGFNQEDSIIMNKSAVDRGLFQSTYYRTYKEQNNRNHSNGEEEFFVKPSHDNTKIVRPFNYDKLEPDGFVKENTAVDAGDIIIGKCMPQKIDSTIVYKDTSIALKNNEVGYVDRNCYDDKYFTNVNGDGYTFCKVRIRNARVPSIGDKFSCYSPDHDVLTLEHGWIPIAHLTKDHKVATLVDEELVYQNPIEIQSYDYQGKMYKLETNQIDLLVTPNHRMYVSMRTAKEKYKLPLAEEVFGARRHYSKNARAWNPETSEDIQEFIYTDGELTHFKLGERALPIAPWLTFLGVWFAEGSSCKSHGYISIAAYKPRVKEALSRANELLNLDIRMQKDKRDQDELNAWRIYEKDVFNFFSAMGCTKSINKKLPQWVFALPRHLCQIFLDGMLLGDGHTMTNGTERYDTSSLHLRDQFQQLCLHAGHSANCILKYKAGKQSTKQDGYVITSTMDAWRLTVVTSQNSPMVNKTVQQDSWVDYDGKVHCCTVPRGNGVIYVRRNGKVTWCGQSRHGQKGTIGMLYRQEDMPFTKDGIVPDIIVNPHAIPSRMTIAQLMECLMGKACTSIGTYGDATPFTELSVEDIAEVLQSEGLERYGNEVLYNSRTGEQIATQIFIGPTFYQRLKHMTCDKVHSRSNAGPIVLLTRQPSEGRAREGGLRIGEMEQEVHIAHGIQSFLKERFMESADNYRLFVCKKCGFMSIANPDANIFMCKPCKNTTHFKEIRIPYAAKLLFQEMQTMSIGTRFITKAT